MKNERTWFQFFLGTDPRVAVTVLIVYALCITYLDPVPLDTLSLAGRQALVLDMPGIDSTSDYQNLSESEQMRDRLSLVTYHWFNIETTKLIPNTPILDFLEPDARPRVWRPTAILDNGTVVWTSTRDGKNYKIMKYENGKTSEVASIPLFDLPSFADAYEKGTAQITEKTINSTGDVFRMPFIVYPDNSIGWLDAMATKGDGKHLTEAEIRVRRVDVGAGEERERQPLMSIHDSQHVMFAHSDNYGADIPASYPHRLPDIRLEFSGHLVNSTKQYIVNARQAPGPTFIGTTYLDNKSLSFSGINFDTSSRSNEYRGAKMLCSLSIFQCSIMEGEGLGLWLDSEGTRQISSVRESELYTVGLCDTRFTSGPEICFSELFTSRLSIYKNGVPYTIMRGFSGTMLFYFSWKYEIEDVSLSADRTLALVTIRNSRNNRPQIAIDMNTGRRATLIHDRNNYEILYLK